MMNQFICQFKKLSVVYIVMISIAFFTQSCKKEAMLSASGIDNVFTNVDNPNDPIDHAIYKFYKATGVPSFYTDTGSIQKISKPGELPEKFRHIKLSLDYYPTGNGNNFTYQKLNSKQQITNVLPIIQFEVFPRLPTIDDIPSMLYIDSLVHPYRYGRTELSHGFMALSGFNTVGIVVKDVQIMSDADKKMYAASLLVGFAEKKIRIKEEAYLQQNFFNVSRALAKNLITSDVYLGFPIFGIPPPKSMALLHLPLSISPIIGLPPAPSLPTEDSDLRSFLTMLFRYTEADLTSMYENDPLILQKFKIIRQLLIKHGYKLLD